MEMLPMLGEKKDQESTLFVTGAKWRKVAVKGWPHTLSQKDNGRLFLDPRGEQEPAPPGMSRTGIEIKNPVEDGSGLDFEIFLSEPVYIFGDVDTLMIASQDAGVNRSIAIEAVTDPHPSMKTVFSFEDNAKVTPILNNSDKHDVQEDRAEISLRLPNGSRIVSIGEEAGPEIPAVPSVGSGHGPMMIAETNGSGTVRTKLVILELSENDFPRSHPLQFGTDDIYLVLSNGRRQTSLGTLFSMQKKGQDNKSRPHALVLHKNYMFKLDGDKCSINNEEGMSLLSVNPYDGPFCRANQGFCQFVMAFADNVPFDEVESVVFKGVELIVEQCSLPHSSTSISPHKEISGKKWWQFWKS
jgi:hypothetical protein